MKQLLAVLFIFFGQSALGKSEERLSEISATMLELSQKATGAFICSFFTGKDEKERERLFMVGLETGREFLKMTDKTPQHTPSRSLSSFWASASGGPTHDFVMGSLWTGVSNYVFEKYPYKDREAKHAIYYAEGNCRLVK